MFGFHSVSILIRWESGLPFAPPYQGGQHHHHHLEERHWAPRWGGLPPVVSLFVPVAPIRWLDRKHFVYALISLSLWTRGPIDRPITSPANSGAVPAIRIPVLTSFNFDWARHYDNHNRSGTGDLGTIWTISRLLLKSLFNVLYGGSVEWSLNQPEWTQWEYV